LIKETAMDANVPQAHQVRKVSQVRQDLQDLKVRVDHLENQALRENQALSDLLVRLESVLVNAQEHWYHKTTLLKWMIITLGLLVLDRLLLHSPQIASLVAKLL
jgi:ATP-dependent helicase/DNAse subunit B